MVNSLGIKIALSMKDNDCSLQREKDFRKLYRLHRKGIISDESKENAISLPVQGYGVQLRPRSLGWGINPPSSTLKT